MYATGDQGGTRLLQERSPSWRLARKASRHRRLTVIYDFLPHPPNRKERQARPGGRHPGQGPLRSGRGPPALPSPRQLAAEPGPPLSPGSSGSSASSPAGGEAASNLPERAKGERGGAGHEATASPVLERTKFPFCALRGATLGPRSRLRDAALNDSMAV